MVPGGMFRIFHVVSELHPGGPCAARNLLQNKTFLEANGAEKSFVRLTVLGASIARDCEGTGPLLQSRRQRDSIARWCVPPVTCAFKTDRLHSAAVDDETRILPDSRLAEWNTHMQEAKLPFFVAALFREHVESACRIRFLQSLALHWSDLSITLSLLSLGTSHLRSGHLKPTCPVKCKVPSEDKTEDAGAGPISSLTTLSWLLAGATFRIRTVDPFNM